MNRRELSGLVFPIPSQRRGNFFYGLIEVVSDLRGVLVPSQVRALFTLYEYCQPLALLFENDPIDALLAYVENEYTDRYFDPTDVECEPLHWLLNAAGIYFARSADDSICHIVDRILEGIHRRLATQCDISGVANVPSRTTVIKLDQSSYACRYGHPASPFLLLGIYLAKHSSFAAATMHRRGILCPIEYLYNEFLSATYQHDGLAFSEVSRQHLYQLCYSLLAEISRHCDLEDCAVKQELREEVVAASRALSLRFFWDPRYELGNGR